MSSLADSQPEPLGPEPDPQEQGGAKSRRWMLAGVGAAAAVAGAGVAWWRLSPHPITDEATQAFWNASMQTLDGSTIVMRKFHGRPLLLNFWATWCPPCVEELPLLNRFYAQNSAKGWQVLGLAIDQPSALRKFLDRLPLEFPVALAGLTGTELGRALGNQAGGLPFTVLFGADGNILQRKMGQVTEKDLDQWIKAI